MTEWDAALAAAPDEAERQRLKDLRIRYNLPNDTPILAEYALIAPLLERLRKGVEDQVLAAATPIAYVGPRDSFEREVTAKPGSRWRWPLAVAGVAVSFALMCAISFSAAVSQLSVDSTRCSRLARVPLLHAKWFGTALATVSAWPALPFIIALFCSLVTIAILGYRGQSSRRVWP